VIEEKLPFWGRGFVGKPGGRSDIFNVDVDEMVVLNGLQKNRKVGLC
jgi:hypothetical protein